ncbi:glycosyltransferase family A protein [Demequina sp. NBRC 110051]|uniref:glycosyltransferase family 2 protein n=1 Tax=Demequina sp. NBRC 110051 TaxID=1570340 RepID=UPI000A0589D1|nr:glycosyltransferase family A protein [Demequina sp. NBRC 110051]
MRRLSVVMPNYNYEAYVGAAIDSALAVRWPDVEVIVVDDGSTDRSREIIASYGDTITAIFQDNAGPRAACNAGYAASTGDVVIFLDSDDVLEPAIAEHLDQAMRPGVSKVQFPMTRIDGEGRPAGGVFPVLDPPPTAAQVRRWMIATAAYPTPPGSGNAYARDFLERLFPLTDRCGEDTDASTLAAAPFLGDVVTVPIPLVRYRLHGDNRSFLLIDDARFGEQVDQAYRRHLFALEVSGREADGLAPLFRGRHLLQLRVAHRRLRPDEHPIPTDSRARMLRNALAAPFAPGPEPVKHRILVAGWSVVTLLAPEGVARRLIEARFSQGAAAAAPVAAAA